LSSGDTALVVEFGERVDRGVSERVLALAARLAAAELAGVVELVPTFRSLMVHYDPLRTAAATLQQAIEGLLADAAIATAPRRLWRVPVCYAAELAPDLDEVARATGLAAAEVVRLHAERRYHVYMVGFVPGFPYMGDLAPPLVLPRRADPRIRVPPGAVAIATELTAIYPLESPGGWHLIGTTPVRLFDPGRSPPALFAPGDAVAFAPIGRAEFDRVRRASERGDYGLAAEALAP